MGKKKIDPCTLISNENRRTVTYSKRKRGLIKKCIELSRLCDQYICMTIFDKSKQKLVQYCSSYNFNPKVVAQLTHPEILRLLTY